MVSEYFSYNAVTMICQRHSFADTIHHGAYDNSTKVAVNLGGKRGYAAQMSSI